MLRALGPVACYGLQSVELGRGAAPDTGKAPSKVLVFGRYHAPGRIVLCEQPLPPWRLPAAVRGQAARRLQRAGAVLTPLAGGGAALVEWPRDTLRIFMLAEVLLHELGHHVLQRDKGKRLARIARTRDHEAFARRLARRLWTALGAAGVLRQLGVAGGDAGGVGGVGGVAAAAQASSWPATKSKVRERPSG